jgi:hypothetical protein
MHGLGPINLEKLIDAFTRFVDVVGIRTSTARLLLAVEAILGPLLLIALALILSAEVYESLYAWARGLEFAFHSRQHFTLFAGMMIFSFLAVFVRELVG